MFVPKDDKLRHKVLELLTNKIEEFTIKGVTHIPEKKLYISIKEIISTLKLSEAKFYGITTLLIPDKEILFEMDGTDKFIAPSESTAKSYYSNKYLNQGRKRRVDKIKDNLYIIVSTIAIISALSGLILYLTSIRNTQKEVNLLQKEVQEIKNQYNREYLRE